jgi:hypothetical protein
MIMKNRQQKLVDLISQAKSAEENGSYFSAAIYYKDALELADKLQDSKSIKLCKNKVVEMNKKSIESGNDFKEHEFQYQLSDEQHKSLVAFLDGILKTKDINKILKIIGQHSDFMPKVRDVQALSEKNMPLTYQFATLTSVSDAGHALRGGSIAGYSWFMQMYDLSQKQIYQLSLGRLMHMLLHSDSTGENLTIEKLTDYFSESKLFTPDQLKIVLVGLDKYLEKDYVSAMHILVPQFESLFLNIAQGFGIQIVSLDKKRDIATRTTTLSEYHLDSDEFKNIFGEDFCQQIKFILFEPMGYKIRHKVAHGEIKVNECNFANTTLILYLYLVLLARIKVKSQKNT